MDGCPEKHKQVSSARDIAQKVDQPDRGSARCDPDGQDPQIGRAASFSFPGIVANTITPEREPHAWPQHRQLISNVAITRLPPS